MFGLLRKLACIVKQHSLYMTDQPLTLNHFLSLSRYEPSSLPINKPIALPDGGTATVWAPGIIVFEPETPASKQLVYSCGVHGNETAPIEICDELVNGLLSGALVCVNRLLVLFGNLPAMDIGKRFVVENMNRLFSGAHSQGQGIVNEERRRAKELEEAVERFFTLGDDALPRFHYDLHTAIRESKNEKFAVYPFLHGRLHSRYQLALLADCGVKTVLLSQSPTTTFSYYSSHTHQAHAFTVELGKVMPFGENDMTRFEKVKATLTSLATEADYIPKSHWQDVELFEVSQVINKNKEDFSLHFADDTPNFTDFPKGTVLASEEGATYYSEHDGEAIVFPNANVAVGQRALLTVVPTLLENTDV